MSTDAPDQTLPHDLPVLTEVVSGDDLPTLTDIVIEPEEATTAFEFDPTAVTDSPPTTEEVPFEVPPQLEAHLEALFMQRLLPRLEETQRQAIEQTWAELKEELPQLIRDALPPRS